MLYCHMIETYFTAAAAADSTLREKVHEKYFLGKSHFLLSACFDLSFVFIASLRLDPSWWESL